MLEKTARRSLGEGGWTAFLTILLFLLDLVRLHKSENSFSAAELPDPIWAGRTWIGGWLNAATALSHEIAAAIRSLEAEKTARTKPKKK